MTGVGAAMALGSQKWKGNCALFVRAPDQDEQKRGSVEIM